MLLSPPDAELFFRLYWSLLLFVNQRLEIIGDLASPEEFSTAPEAVLQVREALLNQGDLIEVFAQENPAGLADDELDIARSWRHLVAGEFYVFRHLKQYTVFLGSEEPPVAYGVSGLSQPLVEVIGPALPLLTKTILLPFKDRIVYDGLLHSYNVTFGPGVRRSLNESYQEAKARGVVTRLPMPDRPVVPKARTRPTRRGSKRAAKEAVAGAAQVISGLTGQFCRDHLNDEYASMCQRLTEMLAHKRPSPLTSGQPNGWASGIVRAIGMVNFLDDPSQQPHMKMADIDKAFGVSQSTGNNRSMQIRRLLKIMRFDPEWTLASRLDDNPLVWMLNVNGFLMDIRHAPREAQVVAFEEGLIPYIPADRE